MADKLSGMQRQSKKEIRAAIEKLKEGKAGTSSSSNPPDQVLGHPQEKKANKQRIRKKGV